MDRIVWWDETRVRVIRECDVSFQHSCFLGKSLDLQEEIAGNEGFFELRPSLKPNGNELGRTSQSLIDKIGNRAGQMTCHWDEPDAKGLSLGRPVRAKRPRFRVACKNEMATNQSTTVRPTAFPEDIQVGKDVPRVLVMSSEIPAFGACGDSRFQFRRSGNDFASGKSSL